MKWYIRKQVFFLVAGAGLLGLVACGSEQSIN